ncbi:MAG TPA: hypothetical protein VG722_05690 [Tepidisphaeraceae bacterium]|nr:hypothetical protein [Tepidisphaeraceae bacterium]
MKHKKPKPGSSETDAKKVGGEGDFGVPESDRHERDYTSANTEQSDPGHAHPHSGSMSRETGVGGNASGPGSSSGGDLSPDFAGVGTDGGMSQNGPDKNYHGGPDEAQQTSTPPHKPKAAPRQNLNQPGEQQSTVLRSPDKTTSNPEGADAATNPEARQDDSFAGEVSSDEASGQS